MIRVNVRTLAVDRTPPPKHIVKLGAEALRNLQSALSTMPEDLIDLEWWPGVNNDFEYNSLIEALGAEILTPDVETKTVFVSHAIITKPPEQLAEELAIAKQLAKQRVAELAYEHEINHPIINTDSASQARINGCVVAVTLKPERIINFLASDGSWVALDKAAVEHTADLVIDWVQACFDNRELLGNAVDLCADMPALSALDLDLGWPT